LREVQRTAQVEQPGRSPVPGGPLGRAAEEHLNHRDGDQQECGHA
jgi:hypothetical protein